MIQSDSRALRRRFSSMARKRSKWRLGEFTVRPMIREESLSVNKLTVSTTNKPLRLKNVSLKSRGVYQVNFEYVPLLF